MAVRTPDAALTGGRCRELSDSAQENSRRRSTTFDKAVERRTDADIAGRTDLLRIHMAYVILSNTERELSRVELRKSPVVIGRATDCEISVHDILLSRRHCRLTPTTDGWLVIDLGSRNGTSVGGHKIEQRRLKDGDVVVLGKTQVTFRAAQFIPGPKLNQRPATPMPADPGETVSGTVFAMQYTEPSTAEPPTRSAIRPSPKPRPRDPESFERDDVYSMLEQIASSSWDSIYAVNAQPLRRDRPLPQPRVAGKSTIGRPPLPRASHAGPRISLELQATVPQRVVRAVPRMTRVRRTYSAADLLRKRLSRFTRWMEGVGQLRLF
jgi:pSer/pThr/pTyr-binding forkhead associated (FHA) protein